LEISANVYLAWAVDNSGAGFSLRPGQNLPYVGICVSSVAIENPIASDFIWRYAPIGEPIPVASNNIRGEKPTGSGCDFTLANTPIGDIDLFLNGQRLTLGMDYELEGNRITLYKPISITDILRAGYTS
jgi:hypothetical protein